MSVSVEGNEWNQNGKTGPLFWQYSGETRRRKLAPINMNFGSGDRWIYRHLQLAEEAVAHPFSEIVYYQSSHACQRSTMGK